MRTDQWHVKPLVFTLALSTLFLVQVTDSFAQLAPEVAQQGYADTLFVNGKVVSMDDISRSTSVGTVYQALAVKRDKIMKLGTTSQVRTVAGPNTQVFDLAGKTLIPGIIEPHTHMYGRAVQHLNRLGFKYPPEGVYMTSA